MVCGESEVRSFVASTNHKFAAGSWNGGEQGTASRIDVDRGGVPNDNGAFPQGRRRNAEVPCAREWYVCPLPSEIGRRSTFNSADDLRWCKYVSHLELF